MSCLGPNYNPNPPRVWSRVQPNCNSIDSEAQQAYLKGVVLQYKKNSSNLTKNQRYSQIAKGQWSNRTKVWATQSDKYTNPNIKNLRRVNYTTIYADNGAPANTPVTCPYNLNVRQVIANGGTMVCGQTENICTGVIVTKPSYPQCNPTYDSDVPGPVQNLCWNESNSVWYPRKRYVMTNSFNKFPTGYKFA